MLLVMFDKGNFAKKNYRYSRDNYMPIRENLAEPFRASRMAAVDERRRTKASKRRERMESPGLLLQMNGSPHRWFGDKKSWRIAHGPAEAVAGRDCAAPACGCLDSVSCRLCTWIVIGGKVPLAAVRR
jgi:hypothetical protein